MNESADIVRSNILRGLSTVHAYPMRTGYYRESTHLGGLRVVELSTSTAVEESSHVATWWVQQYAACDSNVAVIFSSDSEKRRAVANLKEIGKPVLSLFASGTGWHGDSTKQAKAIMAHIQGYVASANFADTLRRLFWHVEDLFAANDFKGLNDLLTAADLTKLSPELMTGLIRSTYRARTRLPAWPIVLAKIRHELSDRKVDDWESLLVGLR